jgi:hypothetical protein
MDGIIHFRNFVRDKATDNFGCQILEANTTAAGTDLFGQISYGSLKIRGFVAKAFLYIQYEEFEIGSLTTSMPPLGPGKGNFVFSRRAKSTV